jgi:aspartate/methionine/tyrosine aminotransferase
MRIASASPGARALTAARAAEIQPFEVMEVMARAHALEAAGRRVVHMEIGEPDFTAPQPVVEAAMRALRDGATAYTAALGLPQLREAIAGFARAKLGEDADAGTVAVTAGASGGLLLALALYVDPGDEVLVPDPGYPGYRHFVRAFEGVARPLPVSASGNFQPTLDMVRSAWGRRTIGVLLGSPANPTGTTIPPRELERIAQFVDAQGGVLMLDEIYRGLSYEGAGAQPRPLPGEVVRINSFSKYFCMTGWRLGWVTMPQARVRDFEKLAQHLFICPSAVAQHAALAAFLPETLGVLEERRQEFQRRRDFLLPELERAGLTVPAKPSGAFYIFADCSAHDPDARRFALQLLEKEGVAATPGPDFGAHDTRRYVRFAYTRSMQDMQEAARRIARYCGRGA